MRENKDLETQSVSWFKRLSIIENSTFPKSIYRFHTLPDKIPEALCVYKLTY